jgi:hypothetical protein
MALTASDAPTAAKAFRALGVCEQLAESAAALGWKTPTAVQEQAVPHLLQGEDIFLLNCPTPCWQISGEEALLFQFVKYKLAVQART